MMVKDDLGKEFYQVGSGKLEKIRILLTRNITGPEEPTFNDVFRRKHEALSVVDVIITFINPCKMKEKRGTNRLCAAIFVQAAKINLYNLINNRHIIRCLHKRLDCG